MTKFISILQLSLLFVKHFDKEQQFTFDWSLSLLNYSSMDDVYQRAAVTFLIFEFLATILLNPLAISVSRTLGELQLSKFTSQLYFSFKLKLYGNFAPIYISLLCYVMWYMAMVVTGRYKSRANLKIKIQLSTVFLVGRMSLHNNIYMYFISGCNYFLGAFVWNSIQRMKSSWCSCTMTT